MDGQDVQAVYDAAKKLIDSARAGGGPQFLLCSTYRFTGHHVGDVNREYYRSKQEEQLWKTERDPITLFSNWLIEQKIADRARLDQIEVGSGCRNEEGGSVRHGVAVSRRG